MSGDVSSNADGAPAVGLRVVARRVEDPSKAPGNDLRSRDRRDGKYRIGGLPAGTYDLAIVSSPMVVLRRRVPYWFREIVPGIVSRRPGTTLHLRGRRAWLTFGQVRTGNIWISSLPNPLLIAPPRASAVDVPKLNEQETGAIVGRVVTPLGQPVSNALVRISGSNLMRMLIADANGQFDTGRIKDGGASNPVRQASRFLVPAFDTRIREPLGCCTSAAPHVCTTIELVLARAGAIAGAIVDGAGEPFQGVLVRALPAPVRRREDGRNTRHGPTAHR